MCFFSIDQSHGRPFLACGCHALIHLKSCQTQTFPFNKVKQSEGLFPNNIIVNNKIFNCSCMFVVSMVLYI